MPAFEYKDPGGGFYIGADEKAELIAEAAELEVVSVTTGPSQYGERFTVTVELDGEQRGVTFPVEGVDSRSRLLFALQEYLNTEEDQEPVRITLDRVKSQAGRPVIIVRLVGQETDEEEA